MRTNIPLLIMALVLVSCASAPKDAHAPVRGTRAEGPGLAPAPAEQPAPAASSGNDALDAVRALWARRSSQGAARTEALQQRLAREPMFRKLTTQSLEARNYEFLFTRPEGPAESLSALLKAIESLPDHGIVVKDYPQDAIRAGLERLTAAAQTDAPVRAELDAMPAWQALGALAVSRDEPTAAEIDGLAEAGRLKGVNAKALKKMSERAAVLLDAEANRTQTRADIEVAASVAFFRYALDMQHRIIAHPLKADRDPAKVDVVHADDLAASFEAFAKNPMDGLAALVPSHPNYARTMSGLAYYRKLAASGEFSPLTYSGKLKRGSHGPAVTALETRLAQEGYFSGAPDATFDEATEDAVELYQQTHGYNVTGVIEERHVKSLNIPVQTRIRQIELSLQRWRESEVQADQPLYVRVNVPEFKMEVWEGSELRMKHKVVTGNNNMDYDPLKKLSGHINRTKIFTAKISQVILNPKWHVPGRIQKLEIDYDLLREPDYYARHNFKVRVLPDGREQIYQDSGRGNTLGRVKFNFPNPYGIFMHDTAQKPFFEREIRAFSHGCIRLHDPLEVAYFILEKAMDMAQDQVESILSGGAEKEINLKRPVPIYVEYNSVGVDEMGRMMFFSDVYQYDKDFFDGKIPYPDAELKLLLREIKKAD